MTIKCVHCNKEFEPTNGRQKYCNQRCRAKHNSKKFYKKVPLMDKKCKECGAKFTTNQKQQTYCSRKCSERSEAKRQKERATIARLENWKANPLVCKQCGVYFVKKDGKQKYCSRECRCRWNNENKSRELLAKRDLKRYHTMMGNGHYDRSISVKSLVERAGLKCGICGEFTDMGDHYFKNGTFIAGENYPSVDHILPISKGGTHTWDNVQLAHRRCNTKKKDKLSYKSKNGQLKFSI